jgi:hypothetical protein
MPGALIGIGRVHRQRHATFRPLWNGANHRSLVDKDFFVPVNLILVVGVPCLWDPQDKVIVPALISEDKVRVILTCSVQ